MNSSTARFVKGRILTRHYVGNALHYYLKTPDGPLRVVVNNTERVCFCRTQDCSRLLTATGVQGIRHEDLALKTFKQEPVSALYLSGNASFRAVSKNATDLGIALYEADVRPEQRYLIERFIALDVEFVGEYESSHNMSSMIATRARKAEVDVPLSIVSLDFECAMNGELYSVGLYGEDISRVIMVDDSHQQQTQFAQETKVFDDQSNTAFEIQWVKDEASLIQALIDWFVAVDPDIIIGWAVVTFDLALLYRRAAKHHIPLLLGRNHQPLTWKVEDKFRPETLVLPGRVVLDGIDWLKAAFYQFDSYSLEYVSRELLGEGKAIDDVANRGEGITQMFHQDKVALAKYNLTDCRLVWDVFQKTALTEFALERSRLTGLELGRVGASVAAFNHLYLPHLHRAGYIAPSEPASDGIESPGGYVMDSIPGLYKNILVLDFKSLYPSIIRTFLIDPKGLVEGLLQDEGQTVSGFLGGRFSRQDPILPKLIAQLANQRELAKKHQNAPLSQAIKIIMNSLYGVLGSRGCVFHDAKLASSITLRGHQIMKQTRAWIEALGLTVIYGDTDSTFVHLADVSSIEDIDDFAKQLVKRINLKWQKLLKQDYDLDCYLELEYERHYEQFFMPTLRGSTEGSKKRYVGAYTQPDGELKLIFKGMEQVRSDWSPLARQVQAQLYYRLFAKQDVVEYLAGITQALQSGELDELLVFTKRLRRDIEDYTAKSSPHVKAAGLWCERSGDPRYGKRGAKVEYVITTNGAQPIACCQGQIDYQYYLDKQIAPISDPVLSLLNTSFSEVTSKQLSLI
ncbi:DNA polymerase II [Shewanella sp. Isolate11]|uniref:DNA polymerase II n=1 Tax=Shewanella sp. Isolate11 TaxID=2908530 RepID=UPI001EFCFB76|nr:DNA polymerase II [Shewanella sp. Isolate11]MCG9696249.1 DNA polymerase II [Shewanella sp. Isolate11]